MNTYAHCTVQNEWSSNGMRTKWRLSVNVLPIIFINAMAKFTYFKNGHDVTFSDMIVHAMILLLMFSLFSIFGFLKKIKT